MTGNIQWKEKTYQQAKKCSCGKFARILIPYFSVFTLCWLLFFSNMTNLVKKRSSRFFLPMHHFQSMSYINLCVMFYIQDDPINRVFVELISGDVLFEFHLQLVKHIPKNDATRCIQHMMQLCLYVTHTHARTLWYWILNTDGVRLRKLRITTDVMDVMRILYTFGVNVNRAKTNHNVLGVCGKPSTHFCFAVSTIIAISFAFHWMEFFVDFVAFCYKLVSFPLSHVLFIVKY